MKVMRLGKSNLERQIFSALWFTIIKHGHDLMRSYIFGWNEVGGSAGGRHGNK